MVITGKQRVKAMEIFGRKEARLLPKDHVVQAGDDGSNTSVLEGVFNFQPLKDAMLSLKMEADRWMGILEMGLELNVNGVGNVEGPPLMIPLTSQDGMRADSPPPWYSATSDNTQEDIRYFHMFGLISPTLYKQGAGFKH